jgi:hypothetical protein
LSQPVFSFRQGTARISGTGFPSVRAVSASQNDQATLLSSFGESCSTFRTTAISAIGIARLFVVFATTHFLLDPSVLDELPKSFDRVLDFLPVSKSQLDHQTPLFLD